VGGAKLKLSRILGVLVMSESERLKAVFSSVSGQLSISDSEAENLINNIGESGVGG
jgi:hypothetical protein